jgi:hypothetical protein
MARILVSWLTQSGGHGLVDLAAFGLSAMVVRYAGAYVLVVRCLRHTRPEDRPQVLQAAAEVLRSLHSRRTARRPPVTRR